MKNTEQPNCQKGTYKGEIYELLGVRQNLITFYREKRDYLLRKENQNDVSFLQYLMLETMESYL